MSMIPNIVERKPPKAIYNRELRTYKTVNWANGVMYEIVRGEWIPWGGMPEGELPEGWEISVRSIPPRAPREPSIRRHSLTVNFMDEAYDKVSRVAYAEGVSMSEILNRLVMDKLEDTPR